MGRCRAVAVVCLLSACAGGMPPPRSPLARTPSSATEVPDLELRALLLLLVDRQTFEPYTVEQALAGGPALRRQLAVSLGRVGDPRALAVLEELSVDGSPDVRRAAVFALGQLAVPAAVRVLLPRVADADGATGALAVEALAKLGSSLASVVAAGARLPEAELETRLLPALWRFREPEVVQRAVQGLAGSEPELRAWAAFALARDPRPAGAPVLRRLLADGDARIRAWAARALGQVGEGADLGRLRPLLDDAEPGPVIRALGAARRLLSAGRAAPPDDWRGPLVELLDSPHRGVRLAAIEAAATWLLDDDLGDRLMQLATDGAAAERHAALVSLAVGGEPRAGVVLHAATTASNAADRAAAATAAGALAEWELSRRLLEDPEPRVRQAALAVLLKGDPQRREVARAALADSDAGVRAAVLGWLATEPLVPVVHLIPALGGERYAGEVPELPLAGIRALVGRARAEPSEVEGAAFALERYAAGSVHLLRRAAADALVELGRSRPPVGLVESRRRTANYEQIVRRTWQPREVVLVTEHGEVRLRLACPEAPLSCLSFLQLVENGFYDGLTFHRVVPDFVVQGGDPRGDGWGGPGYTLRDEVGPMRFTAGTLGLALGGADTGGSQFFITLSPQPHLDGTFTAFGRVVDGWPALERIGAGDRILSAVVVGGP